MISEGDRTALRIDGARLMRRLDGLAVPVLSNHDGLVFDVYDADDMPEVVGRVVGRIKLLPLNVEDTLGLKLTVPIQFSAEIGPNLYDMQEISL